ncbi:MAG: hypothetical protein K2Y12_08715, partial [Chitinophagaceae bacterium]|nr:hypothetical protein [Chitinophagaceae bacterium]
TFAPVNEISVLLSKIVVPKIESKSQQLTCLKASSFRCYQRSLFLKLKANHPAPSGLSKIIFSI